MSRFYLKKKLTILLKSHMSEVGHTWHTHNWRYTDYEVLYWWVLHIRSESSLLTRQLRLRRVKNFEPNSHTQQAARWKSSLPTLEAFPWSSAHESTASPWACDLHICSAHLSSHHRALSNTTILPWDHILLCVAFIRSVAWHRNMPFSPEYPWTQSNGVAMAPIRQRIFNVTLLFTD